MYVCILQNIIYLTYIQKHKTNIEARYCTNNGMQIIQRGVSGKWKSQNTIQEQNVQDACVDGKCATVTVRVNHRIACGYILRSCWCREFQLYVQIFSKLLLHTHPHPHYIHTPVHSYTYNILYYLFYPIILYLIWQNKYFTIMFHANIYIQMN